MIGIIDYGAGNIKSVEKALECLGEEVLISKDPNLLNKADKLILPGVGAFGNAMKQIRSQHLDKIIYDMAASGKPFMGICLGLQLLFEGSEENKGVEGLGILKGQIRRIPDSEGLKVPQVGWNNLKLKNDGRLFKGMESDPYVYFVHSYYLQAEDPSVIKAVADYGVEIHASIEKDNIFACQFHPEKSGEEGLKMLKNFADL
ncbi:MAG TPA: imidazole glycerol phosphate synthase subunit HisH [Candidatus Merdenecus merdavium]|nr:imidazole glycerol phosphate synthase subunit HisH [Candidatus Merdenecus merdavium]